VVAERLHAREHPEDTRAERQYETMRQVFERQGAPQHRQVKKAQDSRSSGQRSLRHLFVDFDLVARNDLLDRPIERRVSNLSLPVFVQDVSNLFHEGEARGL
jgi:hypothetical protein